MKSASDRFDRLEEVKRERIIAAAENEFADNGFSGASMNSLVRQAGISKGSLFQYFSSKDRLFEFVVESAVKKAKNRIKKTVSESDKSANRSFFDLLRSLLKSGFSFINEHPHLARIYYRILQSGDAPAGQKIAAKLNQKGQEFIKGLIISAIDRGELRNDIDINKTAFLIDSLFGALMRAYYTKHSAPGLNIYKGKKEELNRWIDQTIDIVSSGLRRG